MKLSDYLVIVAVVFSGGASYFFALAESALFALGKLQSQQLAAQRSEGGKFVSRLLEQPAELLTTIVLGNTQFHTAVAGGGMLRILVLMRAP